MIFLSTLIDLRFDIFDLLINIWFNLIKNRLILIEKRSIKFDTIRFCQQILNLDRDRPWNSDGLESESLKLRYLPLSIQRIDANVHGNK